MTITPSSLALVEETNTAAETDATGSIAPTAGRRVLVVATAVYNGTGTHTMDLSTSITGWDEALAPIIASTNSGTGLFHNGIRAWHGVMGGTPGAGTVTVDWDSASAVTAWGNIAVIELAGSAATPTLKQTAVGKSEGDGGGETETHTTTALGAAATTGNMSIVVFGSNCDNVAAPATPASWSSLTSSDNVLQNILVATRTDFTGTTETCTDLGSAVSSSSSLLAEYEELGGTEQEGFRFRNDDGSETTASWKAAQDAHVTSPLGANIRLRTLVNTTSDIAATAYTLRYKLSTDSAYIPVPTDPAPFPVIEGTAESSTNTAGTSHVITLPASIAATDLVLILMDIGSTSATLNALTDWTEDLDESSANGLKILRYTGTGVPSNPTFTSSATTRSASIAYRISGADKTIAPQIAGTTATGSSATPDPPSVTPTGGVSKSYLFIAFFGAAGEELDDDTWSDTPPTNYLPSPPLQKACGTAGTNLGGMIAAASRQLATGSAENPGTFAKDVSASWRAQTIIVHPAIPPVYVSPSGNITAGGEDTTFQLAPPDTKATSDFVTGRMWDNENGVDTIDITTDDYTELERCLQAQAPAADGNIYQFREYAGINPFTTYTVTPEWTIGTPAAAPSVRRRRPSLVYR